MAEPAAPRSASGPVLGYPEKFHSAVEFVTSKGQGLTEESKLLLYALHQQATVGPCNEPKPWGWSVVNNAKWQSWKQLGDMASMEAMRLYVRTLEEEVSDWWTVIQAGAGAEQVHINGTGEAAAEAEAADAAAPEAEAAAPPAPAPPSAPSPKARSVAEVVVEGSWVCPYIASAKKPPPRYEHAVALVGNRMVLVGGNYGGRYLSDTWALNLEDLTWAQLSSSGRGGGAAPLPASTAPATNGGELPAPAALPPVAGHAAVAWRGSVLVVGGHTKAKDAVPELPVRMLDPASGAWSWLETSVGEGDAVPKPRGGHSATLVGDKVFVFGGEDALRRPMGELLMLDLATREWKHPETSGPAPTPRSAHASAVYQGRYLLIFGGGSVAHCFNDLHVLDTETMEWSTPELEGPVPPPRAGHAGAVLGHTWFIVGGGNNASGCADMYSLELSGLPGGAAAWTLIGNTPVESAIASEGLSLLTVSMAGCLVSYGGYNGRYHNTVHVYRPEGYVVVKPPARLGGAPDAAPGVGGGMGALPAGRAASTASLEETAAAAASGAAEYERRLGEVEAARREAAAAKAAVGEEMALMRRQLDSAQAAQAEAERQLEEARAAAEEEQGKAMRLEVEVAELRRQLGRMAELEKELERYRRSESEAAQRKGSGLWGFISGADKTSEG
eukprot:scaffold13.g351.t1